MLLLLLLFLLLLLLWASGTLYQGACINYEEATRTKCVSALRRTSTSTMPNEWVKQTALKRWIATERRWNQKNY